MAQIDRKFERKLKRIDPINDQIKKIISIKSSLIDRWSIGWSDRKMSAICPTLIITFVFLYILAGILSMQCYKARYYIIFLNFTMWFEAHTIILTPLSSSNDIFIYIIAMSYHG